MVDSIRILSRIRKSTVQYVVAVALWEDGVRNLYETNMRYSDFARIDRRLRPGWLCGRSMLPPKRWSRFWQAGDDFLDDRQASLGLYLDQIILLDREGLYTELKKLQLQLVRSESGSGWTTPRRSDSEREGTPRSRGSDRLTLDSSCSTTASPIRPKGEEKEKLFPRDRKGVGQRMAGNCIPPYPH